MSVAEPAGSGSPGAALLSRDWSLMSLLAALKGELDRISRSCKKRHFFARATISIFRSQKKVTPTMSSHNRAISRFPDSIRRYLHAIWTISHRPCMNPPRITSKIIRFVTKSMVCYSKSLLRSAVMNAMVTCKREVTALPRALSRVSQTFGGITVALLPLATTF